MKGEKAKEKRVSGGRDGCVRKRREREKRLEEVSTSKMFAQDALAHGAQRYCGRFCVLVSVSVRPFVDVVTRRIWFCDAKRKRKQKRLDEDQGDNELKERDAR